MSEPGDPAQGGNNRADAALPGSAILPGDVAGVAASPAEVTGPAASPADVTGAAASAAGRPGDALTEAELEALLFVAERPLARREIASLAGASAERVDTLLGDLEVSLGARGIRLVAAGDQVALATAPETGGLVARYVGGDPARLSPAMLETLAIVAYRQPVTRAVIERVRGVDSDYVLRALLHRRLVVELGRAPTPGRPFLYGTGYEFLGRFGLASLDGLPPLDAEVAEQLHSAGAVADGPASQGGFPFGDEPPGEPSRPDDA